MTRPSKGSTNRRPAFLEMLWALWGAEEDLEAKSLEPKTDDPPSSVPPKQNEKSS